MTKDLKTNGVQDLTGQDANHVHTSVLIINSCPVAVDSQLVVTAAASVAVVAAVFSYGPRLLSSTKAGTRSAGL